MVSEYIFDFPSRQNYIKSHSLCFDQSDKRHTSRRLKKKAIIIRGNFLWFYVQKVRDDLLTSVCLSPQATTWFINMNIDPTAYASEIN